MPPHMNPKLKTPPGVSKMWTGKQYCINLFMFLAVISSKNEHSMIYFQSVIAILNTSVTFAPPCKIKWRDTDSEEVVFVTRGLTGERKAVLNQDVLVKI